MLALIDCNNFFASCEQVFDLSLKDKPLVVLSNNDGCVIARSKEAKELGISMGGPAFEIQSLIDSGQVLVRSANFALYADMSHRVMQTLSIFSETIEFYSIDEAFLHLNDVSASELMELGQKIRNTVKKWTGIPVSVGIASTKTLAKIAAANAKKDLSGVQAFLGKQEIDPVLQRTEVQDIWGIGRRFAKRLKRAQIFSALQLKNCEDIILRKILGVTGLRVALGLRGVFCFPLEENPTPKKSIVCSRSFGKPITELCHLEEAVSTFAAHAVEKLREENLKASFISVFISTGSFSKHFYANSQSAVLPYASSYSPDFLHFAKHCLQKIYQPNLFYKKAGVLLADFSKKEIFQHDLFQKTDDLKKKERLMKALDQINTYYDKSAIFFAAEGIQKNWKSKRAKISSRYTTNWQELLKVK